MKAFIRIALVAQFALSPLTSAWAETLKPTRDAEPDIKVTMDEFLNPDPTDWRVKHFRLIYVINKAPSKAAPGTRPKNFNPLAPQTMTVLQKNIATGKMEQIGLEFVSTGRNKPEYGSAGHQMNNAPYFSQTHAGYFVPTLLNIDHVSGRWEDALMEHAVFFNQPEGEAVHLHPKGTGAMLGNTASGGCARTTHEMAKDTFWRVRYVGGPLKLKEDKANYIWNNDENHALETGNKQFMAEYQEMQDNGWGKLPDAWSQVPVVRPSGPVMDKNGQHVMTDGYQALFIVVNQPEEGGPTEEGMTKKRLAQEEADYQAYLQAQNPSLNPGYNLPDDYTYDNGNQNNGGNNSLWDFFGNDDDDQQPKCAGPRLISNTNQGPVYEDCSGFTYLQSGKKKIAVEVEYGRNGKVKRISTFD